MSTLKYSEVGQSCHDVHEGSVFGEGERQGGRRGGGARIKREGQGGGGGDIPYFLIEACAVFIRQGPQVRPTRLTAATNSCMVRMQRQATQYT